MHSTHYLPPLVLISIIPYMKHIFHELHIEIFLFLLKNN